LISLPAPADPGSGTGFIGAVASEPGGPDRIGPVPIEGSTVSQENVDLVTGGYDDFNRGDMEGVTARFSPEIEWIGPGGGSAPAGTFRGPQSVANEVFASVPQNFHEFTCTVSDARDEGDTVVVTAQFKGKNKSGAELDAEAEHTWTVRDGKIVRTENQVDREAWAKGWS
jgi:ketosteroid isomerase-like protein